MHSLTPTTASDANIRGMNATQADRTSSIEEMHNSLCRLEQLLMLQYERLSSMRDRTLGVVPKNDSKGPTECVASGNVEKIARSLNRINVIIDANSDLIANIETVL